MANQTQIIGVPSILYPVADPTAIPSLASLVYQACAVTPAQSSDVELHDINKAISSLDTYNFIIGLVGRDTTNGGYTISQCSPVVGPVTVSGSQTGIEIFVNNANWPANFSTAVAVAVFMKINAGNYQIVHYAYLPPSTNFSTLVIEKPLPVAASFTQATLQSTSTDTAGILGTRTNVLGYTFEELTPTTGTFNFRRAVTNVTVSPNNSGDYQVATTRSPSLRFQVLQNDLKTFIRAGAGNFAKWTSVGDSTVTYEGHKSLFTASAVLTGNRPLQVVLPQNSLGQTEIRLLIGQLTTNQVEIEEAWSKTAPTPVQFQFDAAALDKLITNQHTEISWYKG